MSGYENVVAGKLRLKGKALDVKDGGIKKGKKHKHKYIPSSHATRGAQLTDESSLQVSGTTNLDANGGEYNEDERLTPAERRYLERLQRIGVGRLAKAAKKSHCDRIQEFNQYLANLSEHCLANYFACLHSW